MARESAHFACLLTVSDTKLDQEKLEKHKQYLIQLVGLAVQAAEPAISGEHHEKSIQIMEAIIDEIESLLVQEIPIVVVTVAMRLLIIVRSFPTPPFLQPPLPVLPQPISTPCILLVLLLVLTFFW